MKEILKKFAVADELFCYERYGKGHINETYLITCQNKKYILQKINHHVFFNVEALMKNIYLITEFLKNKIIKEGGDYTRETLNIILTKDGQTFYHDQEKNEYYRLYLYVKDSLTLQKAIRPELFAESALAFGKFQRWLKSFDATLLYEVIEDFHNTQKRYEHFIQTLKEDKYHRAKNCKEEIGFVLSHEKDCSILVDLLKEGSIPLRVTHNDTKLNNVLLDKNTFKALCVIDLDTVMPGTYLYDFGDSIRFGCNLASEDERNLSKVTFSLDYFQAFAKSYLKEMKDSLNNCEINHLAFASKLMTLECGIRFLDDYLDGDHYFKIHRENHNLDRCKTQFKLVSEMEKYMSKMQEIIHEMIKK